MATKSLAIIVGGSSGMGLETAKKLAEQGHDLLIIGKETGDLVEAKKDLDTYDTSVETVGMNLYSKDQLTQFLVQIEEEQRPIKHLSHDYNLTSIKTGEVFKFTRIQLILWHTNFCCVALILSSSSVVGPF